MVEKNKDYVQAGRLIGLSAPVILTRHILPNVTGPVFVIATINLALAIITEATLSFLAPACRRRCRRWHADPHRQPLPVLGRVVDRRLSGLALAGLVLAINLLGDWLRDALNPKLQ